MNKSIAYIEASHNPQTTDKASLGFWIYLMTDCILFAALFVTYAVLHNNTNGGEDASALFSMPFVLAETLLLLTSSFTGGLAVLAMHQRKQQLLLVYLGITFALGALFLGMELYEFSSLAAEGNSWTRSGFLSAFFTLVGTHGLHITAGLVWCAVLAAQITRQGIVPEVRRRLSLFSLFWHFLDIVWIFIFTMVYLMGAN